MQGPTAAGRAALWRPGWVVGGVVAVAVLTVAAWLTGRWTAQTQPEPSPPATASPTPTPLTPTEVAALLAPSLVAISIADAPANHTEPDGTGLVVSENAAILTALHVVDDAETIQVTFADGTTTTAALVGADESLDIATLLPARMPTLVVPAVLGPSQPLAVGADVVALGNPLGLTATVTTGVVSGLDRTAAAPDGSRLRGLIQFDAAVNPGSSGGPLVDTTGATVGIVVALVNPTGRTFIGIGLAVPIAAALGGAGGPQK